MGAYREPSEPTRSDKTIVLPRDRVQRVILGADCLLGAATRRGELDRASATCSTLETLGCTDYTGEAVDCETEPFAVLAEVRAALDAGDAERAVGLLGALRFRGAFRDSLEVEALRANGSPAMARVVAERCIDAYGDAEDAAVRAFAERCRGAL